MSSTAPAVTDAAAAAPAPEKEKKKAPMTTAKALKANAAFVEKMKKGKMVAVPKPHKLPKSASDAKVDLHEKLLEAHSHLGAAQADVKKAVKELGGRVSKAQKALDSFAKLEQKELEAAKEAAKKEKEAAKEAAKKEKEAAKEAAKKEKEAAKEAAKKEKAAAKAAASAEAESPAPAKKSKGKKAKAAAADSPAAAAPAKKKSKGSKRAREGSDADAQPAAKTTSSAPGSRTKYIWMFDIVHDGYDAASAPVPKDDFVTLSKTESGKKQSNGRKCSRDIYSINARLTEKQAAVQMRHLLKQISKVSPEAYVDSIMRALGDDDAHPETVTLAGVSPAE